LDLRREVSYSYIKMCMCVEHDRKNTPLFDIISLSNLLFWDMAIIIIFSFFLCMRLHVLTFFQYLVLHVSINICSLFPYFCIGHISSTKKYLERDHSFRTWIICLAEMKGMFLHTSNIETTHICGMYVISILGEW
jgi:hypothetical protein